MYNVLLSRAGDTTFPVEVREAFDLSAEGMFNLCFTILKSVDVAGKDYYITLVRANVADGGIDENIRAGLEEIARRGDDIADLLRKIYNLHRYLKLHPVDVRLPLTVSNAHKS